jgi:multiple sugar transport system permease protein
MEHRRISSLERTKRRWAYAFLVIPIVYYAVIRFYPTFYAFFLSFTDWNIVSKEKNLIGFSNYIKMWQDSLFWKTLQNTGKYVIFGLPSSLVLGFILAYNIDKAKIGSELFKSIYFVPYITSMVAVAWVWRWLYQPAPIGFFNRILINMGMPQQKFLFSQSQAIFAIITTTIWADIGFQMIIFLAGLKGISQDYYEAASLDGAGKIALLRHITLPLLKPTTIFLVVTGTIRYLRIFTQVLNMTYQGEGGPLNSTKPLVLYIYNSAFRDFDMGYASAMTVILFLFILAITLFQLKVMKSEY